MRHTVLALSLLVCSACSSAAGGNLPPTTSTTTIAATTPLTVRLSAVGDSLAAGSGLLSGQNFVTLAGSMVAALSVTNAAIAGEGATAALRDQVSLIDAASTHVIIEIGTADALNEAADYANWGTTTPINYAAYRSLLTAIRAKAPSAKLVVVGVRDLGRGDSHDPAIKLSNTSLNYDGFYTTLPFDPNMPKFTTLDLSSDPQWYTAGEWQANGYDPTLAGSQRLATAVAKLLN